MSVGGWLVRRGMVARVSESSGKATRKREGAIGRRNRRMKEKESERKRGSV